RDESAEQVAQRESYSRAMLLAHEAVQANNFGLVRELLEQTRPFAEENRAAKKASVVGPAPRHLARYEGRDESASVLARCDSNVFSLAISPDGQWLAGGEANGQVLLWRLSDCQLLQPWQMAGAKATRLVFSPESQRL